MDPTSISELERQEQEGKMASNVRGMKALDIRRVGYQYRPVMDRSPREQTIRERAEFLAHEIFSDRMVPEDEIADAIDCEIRRFAKRQAK